MSPEMPAAWKRKAIETGERVIRKQVADGALSPEAGETLIKEHRAKFENITTEDVAQQLRAGGERRQRDLEALSARIGQVPADKFTAAAAALKPDGGKWSRSEQCVKCDGVHLAALAVVALAVAKCYFSDVDWDVSPADLVESKADTEGALRAAGFEVLACECARA